MTQSGPEQKKAVSKAAQRERRAAAAAEKRRLAEELHYKTTAQLETVKLASEHLEDRLRAISETAARRDALSSHLKGFYSEIDKLTKGKTLIPVTDLIVERINEIVRDAKAIVTGDIYLDRVKEWVSAGDNPIYPDVLMTARTVTESLERFKQLLEATEKRIAKLLHEAKTIQVAAQLYLDNHYIPSKEEVKAALGGKFTSDAWFSTDENSGEENFDFDRLDQCKLDEYFSNVRQREVA
jgi:hypothetical protein